MGDYYQNLQLLQLTPGASEAEIREAINRELRLWSNRTNAPQMERRQEAERRLKLIEEAERVLLGPEFRNHPEGPSSKSTPINSPASSPRPASTQPQSRPSTTYNPNVPVGVALTLVAGVLLIIAILFLLSEERFNSKRATPASQSETATPAPSDKGDLLAVIKASGKYGTFLKALEVAGLTATLEQPGPYTVFVPTDEAFANLPAGTLDRLSKPDAKGRLVALVNYHIATGKTELAALAKMDEIKTLNGEEIDVDTGTDGKTIEMDNSKIIAPDMEASNGVAHGLDAVLTGFLRTETPSKTTREAEKSPLGDLTVERRKGEEDDHGNTDEIWLACTISQRPPKHLCNHDSRTGQISFSPDEQWIVVTDGGGPGSSSGTELRAFRRYTQNVYDEIPDAGIADAATRAALRIKGVPDTVELGHVYADVEGWSPDGQTLQLSVWGHGHGYPRGGTLSTTKVDFRMTAVAANYHKINASQNEIPAPDAQGFYHVTATTFGVPADFPDHAASSVVTRTPSSGDYTLYTDSRHGYAVLVPAILSGTLREESSGNTVTATSADGRTKLLLRVKHGVGTLEGLYKEWTAEHTAKDPGKVVDYKTLRNNWFVVSGFDGPRGYYVKVVVRGSEALFLCLEYDEKGGNVTQEMLTTMSRSFTGDTNASQPAPAEQPPASLPPTPDTSRGLQQTLPNGGVADPYANYAATRPHAVRSQPLLSNLSRIYTVPELKKLVGTRPAGAGLRGDFVLVKREGDQVLLQSRADLRNFGITSSTNGKEDVYRGHTFVSVNCSRDMSRFISGQLVTIPAEQALQIISVSKNSQGEINVEASF